MRRSIPTLLALLTASLSLSLTAFAAPTVRVAPGKGGVYLTVGGELITIFRVANDGVSPKRRAQIAADRLQELIGEGLSARDIEARRYQDGWAVFGRGGLLMIATPEEAKERNESAEETARRWAVNLKKALGDRPAQAKAKGGKKAAPKAVAKKPAATKPQTAKKPDAAKKPVQVATAKPPTKATPKPAGKPVEKPAAKPVENPTAKPVVKPETKPETEKPVAAVSKPETPDPQPEPKPEPGTLGVAEDALGVPVGETRLMTVRGTARGDITVRTDHPQIATARVTPSGAVEVRGVSGGRTAVRVERGGKETAFAVWVKKAAGRFTTPDPAEVTGSIAPAEFVKKVAVSRVLDAIEREPGTTVRITGDVEGVKALARGQSTTVTLPVSVSGEPFLTVRSTVRVRVDNVEIPGEEARTLLYSNHPESFNQCQTLFQGLVDERAPARLLFHHQNRTKRGCVFQVHLLNPNPRPVEVQVVGGDAGPFVDPIQVGHRAAERYLAAAVKEVGYIIRVPAGGSRLITSMDLPAEDTVSGIYDLRVMEGGALVAHVAAEPRLAPPSVEPRMLDAARAEPHTYQVTRKDEQYEYTVGGKWAFLPLGRKAIKSRNEDRTLYGNYGVVYNFTVDVDNPTNEAQTIRVMMSPDAGWARGVFLVEGRVVEVPQIAPPSEATVWTFKLAPGERRRVNIQGIPVGGSNYPISLVIRS